MRILLISSNYLPQIGGVEMVVDHLARYLVTREQRVTLVTSRSGAKRYGVESWNGMEVHRVYLGVPGSGWKSTFAFPLLAPGTLLYLGRQVRRRKPDLINLHFADNAAGYALTLAHCFGIPLVVSLHGGDVERLPQQRVVYRWLLRRSLKKAAAVTACSAALLRSAAFFSDISGRRTAVIPNGVEVEGLPMPVPAGRGRPYILTASRLVSSKGIDVVIRGFARLPAVYNQLDLLIAGDGPQRRQLEELVVELRLQSRVHLLGAVAHDVLMTLMAACEVFVLGSRYEAFGIVLLEALAAARPVVATSVGGIPELIADGQNGLLVPPENSQLLCDALVRLLADGSLRQTLGRQGQQLVRAHYTWDKQGERFLDLFRAVTRQ